MVATATATLGAIGRIVTDSTLMVVLADMPLWIATWPLYTVAFPTPIMAHHVDPLHVVCVQFVHRFHVVPIPGVRELVHERPDGRFIIGDERSRCRTSLQNPVPCILTGQSLQASAKTVRFMSNSPEAARCEDIRRDR